MKGFASIILHYNMTAWIFGVVVVPDGGMCKATTPGVKQSFRHNGERVPAAVLVPVSIWFIVIMLKPATYTSQKHSHHKHTLWYVYDDWWFHVDYFDSDESLYLY